MKISNLTSSRAARWLAVLCSRALATVLMALLAGAVTVTARAASTDGTLRVCADPQNMPFSNEKGEGFENKLVDLIADKLDLHVIYSWLPQVVGHVATLPDDTDCDILMGYAQGTGLIEDTNPYYRTSYVLIYRQSDKSLAGVESLADERLKKKTIGIIARTPPVSIMAINGLMSNAGPLRSWATAARAMPQRRLLRANRQGAACSRSPGEGEGGPRHDLRHHHGRAPQRA